MSKNKLYGPVPDLRTPKEIRKQKKEVLAMIKEQAKMTKLRYEYLVSFVKAWEKK